MIKTQCLLIRNVRRWDGDVTRLIGEPITAERFYEVTGHSYGWLLGDFESHDDLCGLPIEVGVNNLYVTGVFKNRLYHTLDLEASNAVALSVDAAVVPEFDVTQKPIMRKFEELTNKKLMGTY